MITSSIVRNDGSNIDDILIYMTQFKKFIFKFNIRVAMNNRIIALLSKEHIQKSFIGRIYMKTLAYI